jgi:hypothetical protein
VGPGDIFSPGPHSGQGLIVTMGSMPGQAKQHSQYPKAEKKHICHHAELHVRLLYTVYSLDGFLTKKLQKRPVTWVTNLNYGIKKRFFMFARKGRSGLFGPGWVDQLQQQVAAV